MNIFKKKFLVWTTILAAGTVVAIAGSTTANAGDQREFTAATDLSVAKSDANYDLRVLDSVGAKMAQLPADVPSSELGDGGLQPETLRLVASAEKASTYVALNKKNQLCVIVYISGSDWTAGSTCTTPDLFMEGGLGLRIGNPSTSYETYLVPDAATRGTSTFAKSRGLDSPTANLIVVDPELSSEGRTKLIEESRNLPLTIIDQAISYEP